MILITDFSNYNRKYFITIAELDLYIDIHSQYIRKVPNFDRLG